MPTPPYSPARIEISIPRASSDGRYWGRYPQGDKPGGLLGIATAGSAASGTLRSGAAHLGGAAAVSSGASGALSGGAASSRVNWHPGWYMASAGYQGGATTIDAGVNQELNALAAAEVSNPGVVKGYRLLMKYGAAETAEGVYHWRQPGNALDQIIARLHSIRADMQLVVTIDPSQFNAGVSGNYGVVPFYIQNNPGRFGPSPVTGRGGFWGNYISQDVEGHTGAGGDGQNPFGCIASWRPSIGAVMANTWADFAAKYNNSPNVEGIMDIETSVWPQGATSYPYHDGTFSNAAMVACILQRAVAAHAAGPKINTISQMSFFNGSGTGLSDAQNFAFTAVQNRIAVSDADTVGHAYIVSRGSQGSSPNLFGWSMAAYAGYVLSGSTYAHGDLRPVARAMMDVQAPDQGYYGGINGFPNGWTTLDLANALNLDYKASHAFFTYETVQTSTSQVSALWRNALPILAANPLTNTGYPSSYPQ